MLELIIGIGALIFTGLVVFLACFIAVGAVVAALAVAVIAVVFAAVFELAQPWVVVVTLAVFGIIFYLVGKRKRGYLTPCRDLPNNKG